MKALLVIPRWSEHESLTPPSGRPHLDLLLECLGFGSLTVMELELDEPFDPTQVSDKYKLILVQDQVLGGRLRRSLLSSLGLSLGLDGDDSDRLRVLGARTIFDKNGDDAGFAIHRRGRIVAYFERTIWGLRTSFFKVLHALIEEEKALRRNRNASCWMIEGAGDPLELGHFLENEGESEFSLCRVRYLPDGDSGLVIPAIMGEEFRARIKERLGNRIYSHTPRPLEEWVGEQLAKAGLTVAVAESCTAGLITARLASVPGSSAYLHTGFVTYSNEAKHNCLDVTQALLENCGAVSAEVALAMARGALRAADSDLAVAVTGIAGPGGGSEEKPVGTVFLAVVARDGGSLTHRGFYSGSRDRIRLQSSQTALHLLRRMLADQGSGVE